MIDFSIVKRGIPTQFPDFVQPEKTAIKNKGLRPADNTCPTQIEHFPAPHKITSPDGHH